MDNHLTRCSVFKNNINEALQDDGFRSLGVEHHMTPTELLRVVISRLGMDDEYFHNISTDNIFVELRAGPTGLAMDDLLCKIYIESVVRDVRRREAIREQHKDLKKVTAILFDEILYPSSSHYFDKLKMI